MTAIYPIMISAMVDDETIANADTLKKRTGLSRSEMIRRSFLFFSREDRYEMLLKIIEEVRIENEKKKE